MHGPTWNYFYDNRLAIETATIALVTAAVKTAPPPGKPFHLYEWFYDWTHQLFNITNTRMTAQPILTPPGNSETVAAPPKP